jgi:methyl-accepting chemotaxis protein
MKTSNLLVLGFAVTLAAAAGCDSKFQDCKNVIDTINSSVERMKKLPAMGMADAAKAAEELRGFGKAMTEEADKIGGIKVETAELKGYVDEYSGMIKEVAKSANDRAAALDDISKLEKAGGTDQAKMNEATKKEEDAQKALQKATEKEDPLVDKINKFCGAT